MTSFILILLLFQVLSGNCGQTLNALPQQREHLYKVESIKENNKQDPPSFKIDDQLKNDLNQNSEPKDESIEKIPKGRIVRSDDVSNTCVDISTFTPVEFILESFEFCTTDLKNVCEKRSEKLCRIIENMECKLVAKLDCQYTETSIEVRKDSLRASNFIKKDCRTEGYHYLTQIENKPFCKNITKETCEEKWVVNSEGKQVLEGKYNCANQTWPHCEIIPIPANVEVPRVVCEDSEILYQPTVVKQLSEIKQVHQKCTPSLVKECEGVGREECEQVEWEECSQVPDTVCFSDIQVSVPYQEKVHNLRCLFDTKTKELVNEKRSSVQEPAHNDDVKSNQILNSLRVDKLKQIMKGDDKMKLPRMSKHLSNIGSLSSPGQQTTNNQTNYVNKTEKWNSAELEHESEAVSTQTRNHKYLMETNQDERLSAAQIQQIYEIYGDGVVAKQHENNEDPKQASNKVPEVSEHSVAHKQQIYDSQDQSVAAKMIDYHSSLKQTRNIDSEKPIILNTPKSKESRTKAETKRITRKLNKHSDHDSKFMSFWDSFFRF